MTNTDKIISKRNAQPLTENELVLLKRCGLGEALGKGCEKGLTLSDKKTTNLALTGKEGILVSLANYESLLEFGIRKYAVTIAEEQRFKFPRSNSVVFILSTDKTGQYEIMGVFEINDVSYYGINATIQLNRIISFIPAKLNLDGVKNLKRSFLTAERTAQLLGSMASYTNKIVSKSSLSMLRASISPHALENFPEDVVNRIKESVNFVDDEYLVMNEIQQITDNLFSTSLESCMTPPICDMYQLRRVFSRKQVLIAGGRFAFDLFNFFVFGMQSDTDPSKISDSKFQSCEWSGIQGTYIRFLHLDDLSPLEWKNAILATILEMRFVNIFLFCHSPLSLFNPYFTSNPIPEEVMKSFIQGFHDLLVALKESKLFNGNMISIPNLPLGLNLDSFPNSKSFKKYLLEEVDDAMSVICSVEKQILVGDAVVSTLCECFSWTTALDLWRESLLYVKYRMDDGIRWNHVVLGWITNKVVSALEIANVTFADASHVAIEPTMPTNLEGQDPVLGTQGTLPLPPQHTLHKILDAFEIDESEILLHTTLKSKRAQAEEDESIRETPNLKLKSRRSSNKSVSRDDIVLARTPRSKDKKAITTEMEEIKTPEPMSEEEGVDFASNEPVYENVPSWIRVKTKVIFYDDDYEKWYKGTVKSVSNEEISVDYAGFKGYAYKIEVPAELGQIRQPEEHARIMEESKRA